MIVMSQKFVPLEKMSKKAQKAHHAKARGSWGGVCPVSRKGKSPHEYKMKKAQMKGV